MKNLLKTPFGSALAGGLVVAVLGVAATRGRLRRPGRRHGHDHDHRPFYLAEHRARLRRGGGNALTVNQIYKRDSPGVVFIQAEQQAQQSRSTPSARRPEAAEAPRPAPAS